MRIEGTVEKAEGGGLSRTRRAYQRDVLARQHRERHILNGRALSVIREADILKRHLAGEAPDILGVRAIVNGRRGVENLEESRIFGACMNIWLTKLTACSRREISIVAMLMNITISPMVASPFRCKPVPTRNTAVP